MLTHCSRKNDNILLGIRFTFPTWTIPKKPRPQYHICFIFQYKRYIAHPILFWTYLSSLGLPSGGGNGYPKSDRYLFTHNQPKKMGWRQVEQALSSNMKKNFSFVLRYSKTRFWVPILSTITSFSSAFIWKSENPSHRLSNDKVAICSRALMFVEWNRSNNISGKKTHHCSTKGLSLSSPC